MNLNGARGKITMKENYLGREVSLHCLNLSPQSDTYDVAHNAKRQQRNIEISLRENHVVNRS